MGGSGPAADDLVLDGLQLVSGTDDARGCGVLVGLGFRARASDAEARHDPASRITLRRRRADLEAAAAGLGHDQPTDTAVMAWRTAEVGRLERDSDPELWARAAGLWSALGRRFPTAYARWREAETRLDAEAVATVRTAHAEAGALGLACSSTSSSSWPGSTASTCSSCSLRGGPTTTARPPPDSAPTV